MSVQAYIYFNGNCREAVEFYSEAFKTEKPRIMLYGDTPGDTVSDMEEEMKSRVMHTNLMISGSLVMFSDVPPGVPYTVGNHISLTVVSNDENELRYAFDKIKKGGTDIEELHETFWSKCYGSVTDKYGISWQLSLDSEH